MSIRAIAAAALRDHGGDVEKAIPAFIQAARKANKMNDLARIYLRMVATQGIEAKDVAPRVAAALTRPSNVTPISAAREQRRQTPEERAAARRAALDSVDAIYDMKVDGRALGRIRFGELDTLIQEGFTDAANMLLLSKGIVKNTAIYALIRQHCGVVPDSMMEIRDGIDAKKLSRLVARAEQMTPALLTEVARRASGEIQSQIQKTISSS